MNLSTAQLQEIFLVFYQYGLGAPPDAVAQMRAAQEKKKSRSGMLQAINDSLLFVANPGEKKNAVDSELKRRGLPSIHKLAVAMSKKHKAVLRRGSIRTDEEYYLLKNLVDEPLISQEERAEVAAILEAFEAPSKNE